MAEILSGKEVAAALNKEIQEKTLLLRERHIIPTLAIVRVGENKDDISYERSAARRCEALGIGVKLYHLPADVTQEALLEMIHRLNEDTDVHGVLMFRPLPKSLDEAEICRALAPEKDVDGITDASMAAVYSGRGPGYPPCTPAACIRVLDHYGISCEGKKAVVIGRSLVVGRPLALMLMRRNATVTICHTRTKDLAAICREADIVAAAAGKARMVTDEFLSPGQVILDVGIHVAEDGSLCGDVEQGAAEKTAACTPVPGGVGAVTTAMLISHVVESAYRSYRLD